MSKMKMKLRASGWILFSALIVGSASGVACPKSAPDGFLASPNQAAGTYSDKDKNVVLILKCSRVSKPQDVLNSLNAMGEVHVVSKTISYIDVTKGAMRIYVDAKTEMVQVAVVSKSPEALEKASPAILKYLEQN